MTGKYRIEIELLLDESTATQALALASFCRKTIENT
jgi:hypothetical protein